MKIKEIYAFISTGEEEGVIGMTWPVNGRETFMPFVCADKERVESLKKIAKNIAKESNTTIRLIKLTNRIDLETLEP